jgi:hypothetical protein
MIMTLLIISVVGAYLLALCAFVYCIHVSVVYHRFNEGIKEWAENLDNSTKDAINRSAREILRELDERISEANLSEETVNDNV